MNNSGKDFYKFIINAIIKAKENKDPGFDKILDDFVSKLDEDISSNKAMRDIEESLKSLSQRVFYLDKNIVENAKNLYLGISRRSLQKRLVNAHEYMGFHVKNQNIKAACKYLIVQVELLCNHIAVEADLVSWVQKSTPARVYLSTGHDGQLPYLSTWNLLKAIDRRFSLQFDENAFYEIKQIRDYESHGFHENRIQDMENVLLKVTSNWIDYEAEGIRFIEKLIIEYYNYP